MSTGATATVNRACSTSKEFNLKENEGKTGLLEEEKLDTVA